jgi:hypothetical protein
MESVKSCSIAPASQQDREVEEILTIARRALRPVALCAGELINSIFLYRRPDITTQPISPAEHADLENEAGRSLTEEEAQRFRIRKLKKQLINNMLAESAPTTRQDRYHDTEARIFSICARAGVCCIGIQQGFGKPGLVLFQPVVTTLAVPLLEFDNPDKAIELIKQKVAELGKISKDFVETIVIAALAFSIGLNLGLMLCRR